MVAELVLYPLLICDLIELIVGKSYRFGTADDRVNFILFVLSIASLFFYVYVVRFAVLAVLIHDLNKKRRPLTPEQREKAMQIKVELEKHELPPKVTQPESESEDVKESDEMISKIATKDDISTVLFHSCSWSNDNADFDAGSNFNQVCSRQSRQDSR